MSTAIREGIRWGLPIAALLCAAILLNAQACAFKPTTVAESFTVAEAQYGELLDKANLWIRECSDQDPATKCNITKEQARTLNGLFNDYQDARDAALLAQSLAQDVDFSNHASAAVTILTSIREILQ